MAKGGISSAFEREVLVINGDLSTSLKSNPYQVSLVTGFSIQAKFAGSPVGNIKLQISDIGGTDDTDWADYPSASLNIIALSANPTVWVVTDVYFAWVRVVYTATSGSGTLNVSVTKK